MSGLSDPAKTAVAVTPSDTVDLPGGVWDALYVGTAGTLTVTMMDGTKVAFGAATGWMPIRVSRVWATGTAASNIVAVKH